MNRPNRAVRRAFLLARIMVLVVVVAGINSPPARASGPLVLAFYYAWFDMGTWHSGRLPDLPAQPYVSADANTIDRHVAQGQAAGIDGFVQSWYGPGGDNQTEVNFQLLLATAAARGFVAAVDFEVGSPYFASPADRIAALQYLLSTHVNHPAYLRIDGKPVVFFWASWLFPVDEWAEIRAQVDPNGNSIWIVEGASADYLSVFDGLHLYNIAWSDNPADTLAYWGAQVRGRADDLGTYKYWAATVMPGWDDTHIPGRSGAFVRDRAGGAYYQQCWTGAVSSRPDMVIITSFNEWLEGSMIEPSVGYGDSYLSLTAQLAAAYKAGGVPSSPPLPQPDPTAAAQLTPSPTTVASPRPSLPPTNTVTPRPDGVIVHDVEPGDTLLGIAGRYGVELDELLVANGLESESILAIGQPIVITTVSPTPTLVPASPTIKPALEPTLKPGPLDERPAAAALPEKVPAVVFPAPTAPPSLTSVPTPAPTARRTAGPTPSPMARPSTIPARPALVWPWAAGLMLLGVVVLWQSRVRNRRA